MPDICVVLPISFGMEKWLREGDLAGEPWTGREYHYYLGGSAPHIEPGERVYIVHQQVLRGYAPLVRIEHNSPGRFALVRAGGAVACTIDLPILSFRGWRYAWWAREDEKPFEAWKEVPPEPVKKSRQSRNPLAAWKTAHDLTERGEPHTVIDIGSAAVRGYRYQIVPQEMHP